ncbi:MAG: DUF4340 domain-containing protein [Deltaproteobacteria bacterium]|nr:DUF4340 domain-containing protein [Deltaproteobacteria bacterium]
MKQGLWFHAGLLGAAVIVAYLVWTGKPDDKKEQPVLVALDAADVAGILYTWPEGENRVVPEGKGADRSYRVESAVDVKKPASRPATQPASAPATQPELASSAPAAPEPIVERERSQFPAGSSVLKTLEALAPLKALRTLGKLDDERLERMGLAEPKRTLTVEAGGRSYTLELGETTYGGQGRYARLRGKPEVHLIANSTVLALEGSAVRLMEWRLVPVELEHIVAIDVRSGARAATFTQVERAQEAKRHFALATAPEERSDEATNLVAKLRALRASKYLNQEPAPGGATEAAAFAVKLDNGAPLALQVYERADGKGYQVRAGRWLAEVAEAQARELVEGATAVLPAP